MQWTWSLLSQSFNWTINQQIIINYSKWAEKEKLTIISENNRSGEEEAERMADLDFVAKKDLSVGVLFKLRRSQVWPIRGRASLGKGTACVKMLGCRGHDVPSSLWFFDFSQLQGRKPSVIQMPLSPPTEASCQPTQPCQQCQLIPGQLQSTKRERIRNRENSHRSRRGHLAGKRAVRRVFFLFPFLPTFHRTRSDTNCCYHYHNFLNSCDSSLFIKYFYVH